MNLVFGPWFASHGSCTWTCNHPSTAAFLLTNYTFGARSRAQVAQCLCYPRELVGTLQNACAGNRLSAQLVEPIERTPPSPGDLHGGEAMQEFRPQPWSREALGLCCPLIFCFLHSTSPRWTARDFFVPHSVARSSSAVRSDRPKIAATSVHQQPKDDLGGRDHKFTPF